MGVNPPGRPTWPRYFLTEIKYFKTVACPSYRARISSRAPEPPSRVFAIAGVWEICLHLSLIREIFLPRPADLPLCDRSHRRDAERCETMGREGKWAAHRYNLGITACPFYPTTPGTIRGNRRGTSLYRWINKSCGVIRRNDPRC